MTNPKVRDTGFCKYMSTEDHLLAVLNAIKGTHYNDSSCIKINTLSGSFYSNIKNDISFMLDTLIMMMIEHQATINPNMPIRMLESLKEYSIFSNHYKQLRKQRLPIDEAVSATIKYCINNNVMKDYLQHNESEVIDMFGFEWNEKEERQALIEASEARGKTREKINSARTLLTKGVVTLQALKSSGYYSQDELAAITK